MSLAVTVSYGMTCLYTTVIVGACLERVTGSNVSGAVRTKTPCPAPGRLPRISMKQSVMPEEAS
jgi:hypothetical protein